MITRVTSKNRVAIPAALARELDIRPGTELKWRRGNDPKTIEIEVRPSPEEQLQNIQDEAAKYRVTAEQFIADLEHMRAAER